MKNYALIDAARSFLFVLRTANESTLDETFQRLATEANDSDYASKLEPKAALAEAIQRELARREHEAIESEPREDCGEGTSGNVCGF